jgi:hypothetical protein
MPFDPLDSPPFPCETTSPKLSPTGAAPIRSAVPSTVRVSGAIALVATVGLLVSGCGSSSSSTTSSVSHSPTPSPTASLISKVDACTLVTAAEASIATATAVSNLAAGSGVQVPGACYYASSDGAASVLVFAQVYPDASSAGAVSPEQLAAAMNAGYGVSNAKAVSGIGDKAVEYSTTGAAGNGTIIFVFKSNIVVMIVLTPATSSSAIEQLAKTAVSRL